MIDHLKLCKTLVSSEERIKIAITKYTKDHPILSTSYQDIRNFFTGASQALILGHKRVCSGIKLVKKAAKKNSTKVMRSNVKNIPNQQELEEDKLEFEKLKAEIAAMACTWTYKWDPTFIENTHHIIVGGEVMWAGYVPPPIQYITNGVCDKEGNTIYGTNTTE